MKNKKEKGKEENFFQSADIRELKKPVQFLFHLPERIIVPIFTEKNLSMIVTSDTDFYLDQFFSHVGISLST